METPNQFLTGEMTQPEYSKRSKRATVSESSEKQCRAGIAFSNHCFSEDSDAVAHAAADQCRLASLSDASLLEQSSAKNPRLPKLPIVK